MNLIEHDYEPVPGLPAPLPAGETILWQGAPAWRSLARRALRTRWFVAYFALLIVWGVAGNLADHMPAMDVALSALRLAGLGVVAIAVMVGFAWLSARTTLYTITNRRVVMRFGIALPVSIQIAYPKIDAAGVNAGPDGSGDIALTLVKGERVAFLLLWPHARPFRLLKAEPAFRAIPDAAAVAQILGRALAASASQPAKPMDIAADVAPSGVHVPAAA